MIKRKTLEGLLAMLALGAAAATASGCCTDVDVNLCLDPVRDAGQVACPDRAEAATELGIDEAQVTSDGAYFPAHGYEVDGHHVRQAATCCYDTVATQCTTELH